MTQQKIPFIFLSPIPKFFKEKGFLKNPKNAAFLLWCFERCSYEVREIFHDNQLITLQPYQFIFGRRVCCDETGLTDNEIRHQQKLWEMLHFLKKGTNKTPNRFTVYEWSTECFSLIHHQQNHQQTTNSPPTEQPQTRTREPIELKEPTEHVVVGCSFSCLNGLVLSVDEIHKLSQFPEVDVIRAVQVFKEQKKPVDSIVGFLLRAIEKKWQPKSNPKVEISELAKSNRDKLMHFKKQEADKLKIKDIDIVDCIDHAMFGPVKIPYEMEWLPFKELVMNNMQRFNITPRAVPKLPEIVEQGKIVHLQSAGAIGKGILDKMEMKT